MESTATTAASETENIGTRLRNAAIGALFAVVLLIPKILHVRRDESHQLASSVQRQLFTALRGVDPGLENWGVKRAPFIVLTATEMPAILAEVGCLSNEAEAQMLRSAPYRQQIAQALFNGIQSYASENVAPQKKGI